MKIGDLVKVGEWNFSEGEVGIITWVFTSGEVVVLFEDGEHQMDPEDMEVIND